jgi:C-terminal processing protease CtpA/Prc
MRNALVAISLLGTTAVPPLVAQANTNIVVVSGDTTINISRGEQNSCTVTVDGKALSKDTAAKLCDQKLSTISFTSRNGELMAVQLERLRNTMKDRELISKESLQNLHENEKVLAEALKLRSLALTDRSGNLTLRSRDMSEAMKQYQGVLSSAIAGRPIIGVTVDAQPRDTDRHGAYVVSVTPNGPADKAGVRATDIITKVDGKTIVGRTERAVDKGESPVWIRLTEVVGSLKPGKEVGLEYRRGGQAVTTKVTPRTDSRFMVLSPDSNQFSFRFGTGDDAPFFSVRPPEPGAPEAPESMVWLREMAPMATPEGMAFGEFTVEPKWTVSSAFGRSFANIELAPVNPKLGEYFGTSTGVLVVDVPAKGNTMGLVAGDVITAVDGREVTSPSGLARILRSYDKAESFTLKVIRNKQSRSIVSTLP